MEFCKALKLTLMVEKDKDIRNGAYGIIQRGLAYNSNKIEGSTLTEEHTVNLFENRSIYSDDVIREKDVEEMIGHFVMFFYMLSTLNKPLSEELIKEYHSCLKHGVFEDIANGYAIGDYKTRKNKVGTTDAALPEDVPKLMSALLEKYHSSDKTLDNLAEFHIEYEKIHPFQSGNGRTGRLILFRECLVNNIKPFIIRDCNKLRYFNGLETSAEDLVTYFKEEQVWLEAELDGYLISDEKLWAEYFRKVLS